MIKNNRKANFEVPSSLTDTKNELEKIAKGDKTLIKDKYYKGEYKDGGKTKFEVRETLKKIYHNKCAYCEIKEYKPEIEHYRPKKEVAGLKNHPGYYWLCYEWTNLIPACRYCNTEGGKGNKFPVRGKRVSKPEFYSNGRLNKNKCKAGKSPLKDELPYLLHPEVDSPEVCFLFRKNGRIVGKDNNNQGRETIKICNLNRQNLLYRRQKIVDNIKERIKDALAVYFEVNESESHLRSTLKLIFKRLEEAADPEKEFSLMSRYCFEHFDEMITPLLATAAQRASVSDAFEAYKAGNL